MGLRLQRIIWPNNSTVWNITTNTGYNNNIFGLARDNSSALHQKQAASTAAGQQLVIGNGTSLFDSNIANTNSLTEMQFLMTGITVETKPYDTIVLYSRF
jgi:hypothetical protein